MFALGPFTLGPFALILVFTLFVKGWYISLLINYIFPNIIRLLLSSNFSFSPVFPTLFENFLPLSYDSKLSPAKSFSLEEFKICCLGKGSNKHSCKFSSLESSEQNHCNDILQNKILHIILDRSISLFDITWALTQHILDSDPDTDEHCRSHEWVFWRFVSYINLPTQIPPSSHVLFSPMNYLREFFDVKCCRLSLFRQVRIDCYCRHCFRMFDLQLRTNFVIMFQTFKFNK